MSDLQPVRMLQSLQAKIDALHHEAARIAKNEQTPSIAAVDGIVFNL